MEIKYFFHRNRNLSNYNLHRSKTNQIFQQYTVTRHNNHNPMVIFQQPISINYVNHKCQPDQSPLLTGDVVVVGFKVALLPIPFGTADFLVHVHHE